MRRAQGFKGIALVECINHYIGKYRIRWDIQPYGDGVSFMEEDILHKPTLQEIKSIIIRGINKQTEEAIQGGFHWRDMPVWLSIENQLNYKTTYDLAVQTGGEALPVVFKFGDDDNPQYFKFEDMETFQDFYFKAIEYINNTITAGWKKKDSINWDDYKL